MKADDGDNNDENPSDLSISGMPIGMLMLVFGLGILTTFRKSSRKI
jgi:hypothetical protein